MRVFHISVTPRRFRVKLWFLAGVFLGFSAWVSAQCVADTSCKDTDEPGQVCPDTLTEAMVGQEYNQPVTFIAPDSVVYNDQAINIVKIELESISNLPPGISYSADTNIFFPDTMYCVLISGVPTDTGTFYLDIAVAPYIEFYGNVIKMDAVHDSTSMFITVKGASLVLQGKADGMLPLGPLPNPFTKSVKIGFVSPGPENACLVIYSLSGKEIYRENIHAGEGGNYFRFTGTSLDPGIYPYVITTEEKRLSGKLVKIR